MIDRHRRLRTVFDEALVLQGSARDAYVSTALADDPDLRAQVKRLLAVHDGDHSFLEHPSKALPAMAGDGHFEGTERFRVLRQLGAGGMAWFTKSTTRCGARPWRSRPCGGPATRISTG